MRKDEETLRKVHRKKGKDPMDDLNVNAPKSSGTTRESPNIHLIDKKQCLVDGSDSEHDFEVNFKHGGARVSRL